MASFLILHKTGPEPTDLVPCAVIEKKVGEVDDAILEGATGGQGEYVAVRFDDDQVTRKQVVSSLAVTDVPEEAGNGPEPGPIEPEPEPQAEPPQPEGAG